jgi:hypothetical protein
LFEWQPTFHPHLDPIVCHPLDRFFNSPTVSDTCKKSDTVPETPTG